MKPMARMGPAPLIDERHFVPSDLKEARALSDALVAAGVPIAQARGVVMWLVELPERRADDPASDVTRSRYRQCLARLDGPPWDREPNESKGALLSSATTNRRGLRAKNRRKLSRSYRAYALAWGAGFRGEEEAA